MITQQESNLARGVAIIHIENDGSIKIQSYDRLNENNPLALKDFQLIHASVCEYLHTLEENEVTIEESSLEND